jgi:hypothetical protein
MGGGLVADDFIVSAVGNHAAVSKWYEGTLQTQVQPSVEIFQWVGSLFFHVVNGIGVYELAESVADTSVLCCGVKAGNGTRKIDKGVRVADAPLLSSIQNLMIGMTPSDNYSPHMCEYPTGTPESLMHGVGIIAEQIQMARPKKRKAMSARRAVIKKNVAMQRTIAGMRRIITLKTFELAVSPLVEEDAFMELAELFVLHSEAAEMYESAFASDINSE